jgi:hypothetical protein
MRAKINNVIAICRACQQVKQRQIHQLGIVGTMPIPYEGHDDQRQVLKTGPAGGS